MHLAAVGKSASLPCQTNTINPATWEPECISENGCLEDLEPQERLSGVDSRYKSEFFRQHHFIAGNITMKEHDLNHFRVLVVDDESYILDLFQEVLSIVEPDGKTHLEARESENKLSKANTSSQSLQLFDVVTCQQGGEAVDAIKSSIKENRPFSVAFIDIRMPPGPDGIWTAEHIRAIDSNIEIVIFTGYSDIHPCEITRRVPPVHKLIYIQKPFTNQEIIQFASALSMKWHTERELKRTNKGLEKSVEARTQEIKESENNFRALAENANEGIILVGSDNRGVYANRKCEEISGYSASELLSIGVNDLFFNAETDFRDERFRQRLAVKPVSKRYEAKIISKAGKTTPIEVAAYRTIWHG